MRGCDGHGNKGAMFLRTAGVRRLTPTRCPKVLSLSSNQPGDKTHLGNMGVRWALCLGVEVGELGRPFTVDQ